MIRILAVTACVFLAATYAGFSRAGERDSGAHHGDHRATGHHRDAQMKRLHAMMPMYAQAQARIIEALSKGDAAVVRSEAGKISATIPDLKKSRPHKNLKEIDKMRKIAEAFEADVRSTVASAEKGDLTRAGAAFSRARKRCDACHAKFRD